jgi:mRNA interferase HigB
VFNIGGNNFRLIVRVDFNTHGVFVLFFGTHADYDRIDASTVEYEDG